MRVLKAKMVKKMHCYCFNYYFKLGKEKQPKKIIKNNQDHINLVRLGQLIHEEILKNAR